MTSLQGVLFAVLVLMVLAWFVCVSRLSRRLRDRHAEKYEQMGLADMWPKDLAGWLSGHNNTKPVIALLRFLYRREDLALHDADVSSLSEFMRRFLYVYLGLFLLLVLSILSQIQSQNHQSRAGQGRNAADISTRAEQRRAQAFDLHRSQKWTEAIAVYDELLQASNRDAELSYWRGMAHWQLNHTDQALQDFRRVIELEPTNFEACRSADRILSRQRRWDEILEIWDRYIEKVPTNADAYFERGGTNFHKGNLAAAQADAAKACELGKSEACPLAKRLKSKL